MIAKVSHQKGGLHNRITRSMPLQPFCLHETAAFLSPRGIRLDQKQLLELTMVIGGDMTTILDELETSGFICRMVPFGRTSRDSVYRLVDELTLFHLRWVEGKRQRSADNGQWMRIRSTPAWRA
jgi:hypothetical protein